MHAVPYAFYSGGAREVYWASLVLRLRLPLRICRRCRTLLAPASFASRAAGPSGPALVPPALAHQLVKLLALRRGNLLAHAQAKMDRGFFQREPRSADFLQFAVDRGAIRLFGGEQVLQ